MSARDWREAARGIPVWDGAAVQQRKKYGRETGRVLMADAGDGYALVWFEHSSDPKYIRPADGASVCNGFSWAPDEECDEQPLIVDLSDPDTRAAYDRRLALALGMPPENVSDGVLFRRAAPGEVAPDVRDGPGWIIQAGTDSRRRLAINTTDPLLARALAWPADKRVTA